MNRLLPVLVDDIGHLHRNRPKPKIDVDVDALDLDIAANIFFNIEIKLN